MNKVKMILAAAVAVFAVEALSAQTTPADVAVMYNEAAGLYNAKDFKAAIPALEAVVVSGLEAGEEALTTVQNAQKMLPVAYFQQGLALCREQKFEEALPYLDNAIEFGELYANPQVVRNSRQLTSQAYLAMGAGAFNSKDYPAAVEIFSKAYEINPNDSNLALYLAESYSEMGDYENGNRIYKEIIALGEKQPRHQEAGVKAKDKLAYYLNLQAAEVAKTGDKNAAYELFDQLLEIDPENAGAQLMRLQTAVNAKDYAKVIQWGEATAAAQTDAALKSDAYFFLGAAYQNTENVASAIANYRKVTAGPNVAAAKAQIDALSK